MSDEARHGGRVLVRSEACTTRAFLATCPRPVAAMLDYWDAKRAGRPMPFRRDIDPCDFRRHLPGVQIVEVRHDPVDYVYRLIGTRECAARGCDPTGRRVRDSFVGSSEEHVMANYDTVRASGSFLYDPESFVSSSGQLIEEGTLFLPLTLDGARVGQILTYSHYRDLWPQDR